MLVAWVKGTMSAVISVKLWDDLTDILSKLTAWDELIIRWEVSLVENSVRRIFGAIQLGKKLISENLGTNNKNVCN